MMPAVLYAADWDHPLSETSIPEESVMPQVLINLLLSMLSNPTSEAALLAILSQLLDLFKTQPGLLSQAIAAYKK